MSAYKPLILANDPNGSLGQPIMQQLQGGSDLDIPLEERFQALERSFGELILFLAETGFEMPPSLTSKLETLWA